MSEPLASTDVPPPTTLPIHRSTHPTVTVGVPRVAGHAPELRVGVAGALKFRRRGASVHHRTGLEDPFGQRRRRLRDLVDRERPVPHLPAADGDLFLQRDRQTLQRPDPGTRPRSGRPTCSPMSALARTVAPRTRSRRVPPLRHGAIDRLQQLDGREVLRPHGGQGVRGGQLHGSFIRAPYPSAQRFGVRHRRAGEGKMDHEASTPQQQPCHRSPPSRWRRIHAGPGRWRWWLPRPRSRRRGGAPDRRQGRRHCS